MKRRKFLEYTAAAVGVIGSSVVHAEKGTKRPNIIFLLTDDQRANTFSHRGHPYLKTPHIDKLAAQGHVFSNAYVAEPTCKPSRCALLTGTYERVNGVGFSSRNKLTDEMWEESYPALLRKAGYYTGFIGKFGIEDYTFKGRTKEKFDFWFAHDGWSTFEANRQLYRNKAKSKIITEVMDEGIAQFLDQAPDDEPFCMSVSFSAPHGSVSGTMHPDDYGKKGKMGEWMSTPANTNPLIKDHPIYGDLYRDQPVEIPVTTGKPTDEFIPTSVLTQEFRSKTYTYNYDSKTNLEHHYRYFQLITGVDNSVGKLMKELEKRGLAEDTVIIYSSDNGLLMGEYGMGGKGLLYDLAHKVPTWLYDPRKPAEMKGKEHEDLVVNVDITSTILDLAGIEQPEHMQGRSLMPLVNGTPKGWRKELFTENLYIGRANPFSEAVRFGDLKYVRYFPTKKGRYTDADLDFSDREPVFEQLFDLKKDPEEVVNLVDNPEYKEQLEKLRKSCRRHSAEMVKKRRAYVQRFRPVMQ
jgi:arylsulfatase A-like enzyme